MIRLLIVLAVVILAAFYMNYNSPRGAGGQAASPEELYEQNASEAKALEQQMQQQAHSQLDAIDAGTQ